MATYDHADVKAGACSYILVGLLQRLDARAPGLIEELVDGVVGDLRAVESQGGAPSVVPAIFQEAQAMLRRAIGYKLPSA